MGNHKGATFHTCWSAVHTIGHCLSLGARKPSRSLPKPVPATAWGQAGQRLPPEPGASSLGTKGYGACLGKFLLLSQMWFNIRPQTHSRNTTGRKGDLGLLRLALVPRAASPKQWPGAHQQILNCNLRFGKASCRVTCPWPCT